MAYDSIYYDVPMMLTTIEAMTFYFAFHFAFRSHEYNTDNRLETHWLPTWRAIFDALNLTGIVHGVILAFRLLITNRSPNGFDDPAPK